jgi:hypothetical protein
MVSHQDVARDLDTGRFGKTLSSSGKVWIGSLIVKIWRFSKPRSNNVVPAAFSIKPERSSHDR